MNITTTMGKETATITFNLEDIRDIAYFLTYIDCELSDLMEHGFADPIVELGDEISSFNVHEDQMSNLYNALSDKFYDLIENS